MTHVKVIFSVIALLVSGPAAFAGYESFDVDINIPATQSVASLSAYSQQGPVRGHRESNETFPSAEKRWEDRASQVY